MNRGHRLALLWLLGSALLLSARPAVADELRTPTVGAWGRIENLLLPGGELVAKPIVDERTPIVLRIENAYPHGTAGFRYDLEFFGTVPGAHDLRDYLQRADGGPLGEVPAIPIEVRSLLPAGQIEPHPLSNTMLQRLGGYRFLATIAVLLWLWVLAGLVLLGWHRRTRRAEEKPPPTLADLLRPRLELALANQLQPAQYAELERMLIAFWRKQLGLERAAPDEAIRRIRNDDEAGPTWRQLEIWMHSPHRESNFDLASLLRPLEKLSANGWEWEADSLREAGHPGRTTNRSKSNPGDARRRSNQAEDAAKS